MRYEVHSVSRRLGGPGPEAPSPARLRKGQPRVLGARRAARFMAGAAGRPTPSGHRLSSPSRVWAPRVQHCPRVQEGLGEPVLCAFGSASGPGPFLKANHFPAKADDKWQQHV